MRKSTFFLGSLGLAVLLLALMFVDANLGRRLDRSEAAVRGQIVKALTLTDLCLVTESRYTRHPSMADRHAAFQEHPLALDHFPSGSFIAVPPRLQGQGDL